MSFFRNRSHLCLAASIAVASLAVPAFAQSVTQGTPAGWTPAWSDEFNGTSVDTNRWNVLTRQDSYNNELQYYTPNAVKESGGTLNITATKAPLGTKQYQSGLVRTKSQQQFGRFEFAASLPAGQGMWPAIWLLAPDSVPWPSGGEIDIMENRGSTPTSIASSYHFGANASVHQYVTRSFGYSVNGTPVSFQGSMHQYAVEWDQSRIRYLIDNVPSYTFYRNTAPISTTPMDVILNLAVGGDFGGNPNSSTQFPQTLKVDYVRVYDRDTGTSALENQSFENKSGSLFQNWDEYSNGGGNVLSDTTTSNAHTGTTAVQMYGRFDGSTTNASGLFQEVPTTEGEVWQVGAFAKNRNGDTLAGGNNAKIRIEFIDQNGAVIGSGQLGMVDANSPTQYREGVVRRTAPAGAKFARAVIEMQQLNNAGGAVDFDDATLRKYTSAATAGDINLDGTRDSHDLDALLHSLTAANTAFDFNGDSSVDSSDVDSLLASAFGTRRGDTNLDHAVNFADLVTLAQNYNSVGTGQWSNGDFNGDSKVDFADLVLVAQNYNAAGAAGSASAASFASDWALAQSLVPEPTTALTGAALVASATRRRAAGR